MNISVIIINRNEQEFMRDCLESVKWADEVILLDGGSTDKSLEIAKEYNVKIHPQKGNDFATWRTEGLSYAKGKWVFYLDVDERVTPLLKNEIIAVTEQGEASAYFIPRRNFLLGKELHYGGWYPDYVKRLFVRDKIRKWEGDLHEEPIFEGPFAYLTNDLVHLQPEKIEPAFQKSIKWSRIEAKLIYNHGHPPIVWWRILRMGLTTLLERLIKKHGFRDGVEGWIESLYQACHTMIVYVQLWEMQNVRKS